MNICFTGDSIMLTSPRQDYWENNKLVELIRSCDIKQTNLEMVLSGNKAYASTFCGGDWMTTDSDKLDVLNKYEFNHYAIANNHTMDYSYTGLKITQDELEARGLVYTGAGESLEKASQAKILDINGTRVAFISCTASCDDAARAGDKSPSIPARPGVNMLRHSEYIYITKEQLEVIDEIAEKTAINARFLKSVRMGIHSLNPEIHRLGRIQFIESNETKKVTVCNSTDLNRIMDEIESVKNKVDFIVVNIHSHDIKGETDDTPAYYMEEFAHKCIDVGANAIIGTGTHQLKAVEIYKNAPIFYSLGNFLFVSEHMDYAPSDYYERNQVDYSKSLDDIWLMRSKNNTVGLEFDYMNYRSIVPVINFNKSGIQDIQLIPIELGFNQNAYMKGYPNLADEKISKEIYCRLAQLSKVYNTKLQLENNNIKVVM